MASATRARSREDASSAAPSATWWHCTCARGATSSSALQLQLREIPASGFSPLFFCCSACATRLTPCESCHVLLDASRGTAGGALLCCRRCGALSVLDASLRAMLAIAPVSRALLKRVPFVIEPLAALRERVRTCDARLQRAKGEVHEEATQPPPSQRKRRRAEDAETASDDVYGSQSPSSHRPQEETVAALEAEAAVLRRQLCDEMRRWEQFAAETTDPSTQLLQHQTFSSTHLNILKVMYGESMDKIELAALAHQIEQFLLHQPTLIKMKLDVLAAVDLCRESEQLQGLALQEHDRFLYERHHSSTTMSMDKVVNMVVNSTKEQLRHRYDSFQTLSRQHLPLVGVANTHLLALYSAAQSLQSTGIHRSGQTDAREPLASQRELFGATGGWKSAIDEQQEAGTVTNPRSWRRYSGGGASTTGRAAIYNESHRLVDGSYEAVSHVQQSLELSNRIAEISKKAELWRALSAAISSTCVLNVLELASVTDSPLS